MFSRPRARVPGTQQIANMLFRLPRLRGWTYTPLCEWKKRICVWKEPLRSKKSDNGPVFWVCPQQRPYVAPHAFFITFVPCFTQSFRVTFQNVDDIKSRRWTCVGFCQWVELEYLRYPAENHGAGGYGRRKKLLSSPICRRQIHDEICNDSRRRFFSEETGKLDSKNLVKPLGTSSLDLVWTQSQSWLRVTTISSVPWISRLINGLPCSKALEVTLLRPFF